MAANDNLLSDGNQQRSTRQEDYAEQSASMMEQIARAREQSRYAIASRFPRQIEEVRQAMLRECGRPSFCMPDEAKNGSSVAWYRIPRSGGGIEGFTIRFAEMARQAWGHTFIDIVPMGEDAMQRIMQVACTDYQTNNGGSEIVIMEKTVERSQVGDATVVSQRTNSYGKPVYTVVGTEDQLLAKRNGMTSKARRNLILELIPGWLKEECRLKMLETARTKDAEDPDAAKRKLFDAFAAVGVTAEQLIEFLGHSDPLNPAELEDLRGYFSAIREGMSTWREIVASKEEKSENEGLMKEIDALFAGSGRQSGMIRQMKSKYAGRPEELLTFLRDEARKKGDTGAKPATTPATATTQKSTAAPAADPAAAESKAKVTPISEEAVAKQEQPAKKPAARPGPPPPVDQDWS